MIREIRDIQDLLRLALDMHKADWSELHSAFNRAFDNLETRFERLENIAKKLEAERREAEGRVA